MGGVRGWVVTATAVALLVVLAVVRSAYDEGPTPAERRCAELRAAANGVPEREDSVDDEVEYRRLDAKAERVCAGT